MVRTKRNGEDRIRPATSPTSPSEPRNSIAVNPILLTAAADFAAIALHGLRRRGAGPPCRAPGPPRWSSASCRGRRWRASDSVSSTNRAISGKAIVLGEKRGHGDFVGGIEDVGRPAARRKRLARDAERREPVEGRAARRSAGPPRVRSRPSVVARPRAGHARQWAIGIRMSGVESAAIIVPSRNATSAVDDRLGVDDDLDPLASMPKR